MPGVRECESGALWTLPATKNSRWISPWILDFFYSISWFKLCAPIIELSCSEYILLHVGSFDRYSISRIILENSLMLERKHERQRTDNWQRRIFHIKKTRLQKLTFRGSTHSFTCLDNTVTKLPWRLVSTALMVFFAGSGWLQACVDMSGSLYL